MPEVMLKGPRVIDGAVRYPAEGPIPVNDEEYDRLVEADAIVLEDEDGDGEPDLSTLTLSKLKEIATAEKVDLGDATKKADIVAAIENHRLTA